MSPVPEVLELFHVTGGKGEVCHLGTGDECRCYNKENKEDNFVPVAVGDPVATARAIIPVNEPAGSVSKIIRVGYLEWQVINRFLRAEVFCRFFSC